MCGELTGWSQSGGFNGWQTNPKTSLSNSLDSSLASVLDATSCSASSIWNKCFELEKLQGNLGTEGSFQGTGSTGSTETEGGGATETEPETDPEEETEPEEEAETGGETGASNPGGATLQCTNGAIKWGCITWNPSTQKCEKHGCRCFENQPFIPTPESCFTSGGLTKAPTTTAPSGGKTKNPRKRGGATIACKGRIRWGCTDWRPKTQSCHKHGCRCFPGEPFQPTPDSCFTSGGLIREKYLERNVTATCFPGDATVVLGDGSVSEMTQLNIGDVVLSAPGKYSQVYLFSHRHSGVLTEHVEVSLADYENGPGLTLTAGHHLRVNGLLKPASDIRVGDTLETVYGVKSVSSLRRVSKEGLYNPHTMEGTIVVNGVICSTYTEEINASAAHALLAPLRALFRTGSVRESTAGTFMQYGASMVA